MDTWPNPPEPQRPKLLRTELRNISPWVNLIERAVTFPGQEAEEIYHAFGQVETVGVVAIGPDGRIPIIRQYRPAIEAFVWELPAGMVDPGDSPEQCCRRELEEEVGLRALEVVYLGPGWPDTGRLGYRHHAWVAPKTETVEGFTPEPGTQIGWVWPAELYRAIADGRFPHQLHVAVVMRAILSGLLPPPGDTFVP